MASALKRQDYCYSSPIRTVTSNGAVPFRRTDQAWRANVLARDNVTTTHGEVNRGMFVRAQTGLRRINVTNRKDSR